jgi:type IV secretion system protein VirD4
MKFQKNRQKWLDKSSPKGEILRDTGYLLMKKGYKVKVLDLIDMPRSHCYNPFVYLRDDNDVQRLVTNLFKSTTPKGAQSQDPFWGATRSCLKRAGTANNLIKLEN